MLEHNFHLFWSNVFFAILKNSKANINLFLTSSNDNKELVKPCHCLQNVRLAGKKWFVNFPSTNNTWISALLRYYMYSYSIWWFWVSFIIIDIEIIVVITIVVFRGPSSWNKPSRIIETGIVSMPVISVTSNSSERINSVFTRLDILLTNEPLQILVLYKTRMQGIVVAYSRGDYWGPLVLL